jgi:hypothetical protein
MNIKPAVVTPTPMALAMKETTNDINADNKKPKAMASKRLAMNGDRAQAQGRLTAARFS